MVFDWTLPKEWNIRDAYINGPDGKWVVDFQQSNPCVFAAIARTSREARVRVSPARDSLYAALNPQTGEILGQTGKRLLAAALQCEVALHANLLVLAQSSRELVQQASARRNRLRYLYLRCRPETQDPALYSPLSESSQTLSLEILRCQQTGSGVVAMLRDSPLAGSPRVCAAIVDVLENNRR
jgi:hypothetical protein